MKKVVLLSLILLAPSVPVWAATCSGGANCTACKNCSACRNCNDRGGKCSVCWSGPPSKKAPPKLRAKKARR